MGDVVSIEQEQKYLSADEILAASDIDFLEIPIAEWKGTLLCKAMTGEEAIQFYQDFKDPEKKDAAVIRLVTLSAVNNRTDQKRIFTEAKVEALKKKKFGIFLRIQNKLLAFNGMKPESADAAKNV